MGFYKIDGDITKIQCHVLINSVGIITTIYGGICGSIINATHSKELEEKLKKANDAYSTGDFFLTHGYGLETKYILHLITPNYADDLDYQQYMECLRRVLNECNRLGLRIVLIPYLGTGANGYDSNKVEEIIEKMFTAYTNIYPHMNIYLVKYESKDRVYSREISREIIRQGEVNGYHDPITTKKYKKAALSFSFTFQKNKKYVFDEKYFDLENYLFDKNVDMPELEEKPATISKYIEYYIKNRRKIDKHYPPEKQIKERVNKYLGYGRKGKDTYSHSGSDAFSHISNKYETDKKTFFKIIFALKMNSHDAQSMLLYFGASFSHNGINLMDDKIRQLLDRHIYGILEIEEIFKMNNINSLFKK